MEIRPRRQLSHLAAQLFGRRTIPLFTTLSQKPDRAAYLTVDALPLGELFQGTANLLSSAAAEELSQHLPLPKHHPRRDTRRQDRHFLYCSGSHQQAVPSPSVCSTPPWKTKHDLKNCCTVTLKLKFLPEFPVTNSKGDFLGVG